MKLELWYPLDSYILVQEYGREKTLPDILPKYLSLGLLGHNGWDMVGLFGQKILASHDGTCVFAGLDGANGKLIVLKTDKQYDYNGQQSYFKTLYCHCDKMLVQVGQKVTTGDVIGLVGNTGMSTGAHLHFGLKPVALNEADDVWYNIEQENGYNGAIDPAPYWNGQTADNYPKYLKLISLYRQIISLLKK